MEPGVADASVVFLDHATLIAAVAAIAVGARVVVPVHDAAEVSNEAAQHALGFDLVTLTETDKFGWQPDRSFPHIHVLRFRSAQPPQPLTRQARC